MAQAEQPRIDWASAEVRNTDLTVELTGKASKPWRKRFQTVLALLRGDGRGAWGEISLTGDTIAVADVNEGSPNDLRHLLESVLLQVNSDLRTQAAEQSSRTGRDDERQRASETQMTAAFRSFAEQRDSGG